MRLSRKHDPDFMQYLRDHATVNAETGELKFDGVYAALAINITFKGRMVPVPYSNVVWFLSHDRWPLPGYHIDHDNNNSFDNRLDNLNEILELDNQRKRRGRTVSVRYGTGKFGYGMGIFHDKRDDRFYVSRHLSRGHGNGDLKTKRISLGGFATEDEALAKVAQYIEEIKIKGLDYEPPAANRSKRKDTAVLDEVALKMREMRAEGKTIQEIANITGFRTGAVYSRIKDINVDQRMGAAHNAVKLDADKVREIRRLATDKKLALSQIAVQFGVSTAMISQIVLRRAWKHVE